MKTTLNNIPTDLIDTLRMSYVTLYSSNKAYPRNMAIWVALKQVREALIQYDPEFINTNNSTEATCIR
jgi:hypothetical protein